MLVSPHSHPESPLTGSTLKSIIDKHKELKRTHFSYTDNGHLASTMKAYGMAKKAGLKFIAGIEFYFKDHMCDIVAGTNANRCKYYTASLYCEDQEAYQELCRIVSKTDFKTTNIRDEVIQLWSWKELEHLSTFKTHIVLSGTHCIVAKNMLAGHADVAMRVFDKILALYPNRTSVALLAAPWTKKYAEVVEVKYLDGTNGSFLSTEYIGADKARKMKASELVQNIRKNSKILCKYDGPMVQNINKEFTEVKSHKGYLPYPEDVSLKINKFLKALANRRNVPILVTDYSYYSNKEDKIVQTMRLENETKIYANLHVKNQEEILDYLINIMSLTEEESLRIINNNSAWAEQFNSFSLKYDMRLMETQEDPSKIAMSLIREKGRMQWDNPIYVERLKEEFLVIAKNPVKNLLPYFFPIIDVNKKCTESAILTGVARGSAGGSLLCYLMGVTNLNPIKYDLSFSRFLSLDRIKNGDFPDVDCDFSDRTVLFGEDGQSGYLKEKYGDGVAQIGTKTTIRLKSAIKDANRYFEGEVHPSIDLLTKGLPVPPQGVSDESFLFGYEDDEGNHISGLFEQSEDLQKYAEKRPQEWSMVQKALGIIRSNSVHPCATILSNMPIKSIVPLRDGYVTQYEAKEVESAGLLKYDFLKLDQLKDIEVCLKLINKKNNEDLEIGYFTHNGVKRYIWDLPEVLEVFQSIWGGDTVTIFQLHTQSMIPYVIDVLPKSVEDISTILALVRPGPLDYINEGSGRNMAEEYVARRNGTSDEGMPELLEIIPETYGVMCVAKGSPVKTSLGPIKIEVVEEGMLVQTENGTWQKVLKNIKQGTKATVVVWTDNGHELKVTKDHRILTHRGWVEAQDLKENDLIKSLWAADGEIQDGDEKDYIIGMLLADGNLCHGTYNISAGSYENAIKIKEIADRAWGFKSSIKKHMRCWYVYLTHFTYSKNIHPLRQYMISEGLDHKDCYSKFWPKNITKSMIEGFLDGDGNWNNRSLRTPNYNLAHGLFTALQKMRIKSYLHLSKDGAYAVGFGAFSKLTSRIKPNRSRPTPKRRNFGIFCPIPEWNGKIKRSDHRRSLFMPGKIKKTNYVSKEILEEIAKDYGIEFDSSQNWSRVMRISEGETIETFDLSIENVHSFCVGGQVVHNCFQEQQLKIAKELGGMPADQAEALRRLFAKKKKDEALKMKPMFMEPAIKKIGQEKAEKIWAMMETFARYSFNKSHSTAYAMISYACMFLKYNYPLEWWAATLTNAEEKEITGKFWPYVKDIVKPPDINLSGDTMVVDYQNRTLRAKLGVMRGIGEASIDPIVKGRPYIDIQDFVNKEVAGDSLSYKLIHVGVLDSLFPPGLGLVQKLQMYEDAKETKIYTDKVKKAEKEGRKIRALQPRAGYVNPEYSTLYQFPLKDAAMKKAVLPSIPVDFYKLGSLFSKVKANYEDRPTVTSSRGHRTPLFSPQEFKRINNIEGDQVHKDFYFAVTCFILDAKEFSFSKNTKRALKMNIDAGEGYSCETVLWPDYESGELLYPVDLKKGAIATIFFRKRANKKDVSVMSVALEN